MAPQAETVTVPVREREIEIETETETETKTLAENSYKMLTFFFLHAPKVKTSTHQSWRLVGGLLLLGTLVFTSRHTIS